MQIIRRTTRSSITETRACRHCGEKFSTKDSRKRYCKRKCFDTHRNRANQGKPHQFIGVDGEGYRDPFGQHIYALLGCGDRHILHMGGLSWNDIFTFLYDSFLENPDAVYVGYFLKYDFTMWVRSMPAERAAYLFDESLIQQRRRKASGGNPVPFPVRIGDWEVDTLGLKFMKIRPRGADEWMHICDVGPFFQKPFTAAINPEKWPASERVCTPEEYALIEYGKNNLRAGATTITQETIDYNQLENAILSRLMSRYDEGLLKAGVRLPKDKFYGPGQAAQAWMRLNGMPSREEIEATVPDWVLDAAQESYYGGWFEYYAHGTIKGAVSEYDINSAYPSVMTMLPCLLHGQWTRGEGQPPDDADLCLVRARVTIQSGSSIGPMPHRTPVGSILRPRRTTGVYWQHEIDASIRAGLCGEVEYTEYWAYRKCTCPPPLAGVYNLYADRQVAKREGAYSAEQALKLIYNSMYGKMAQSIGEPMFSNALYASLITAGCRVMILDAIASHPRGQDAVLMIATDAVYFDTPHPTLPCSDELGEWDAAEHRDFTIFKPGVYWTRDGLKLKSRGTSAKAFSQVIEELDDHFSSWPYPQAEDDLLESPQWPSATVDIPFSFLSPKQAIARGDWSLCGKVVEHASNLQNGDPKGKREPEWLLAGFENRYWRSRPRWIPKGAPSTPYDRRFGRRDDGLEHEITPDGPLGVIWGEED